MRLIFLYTQQKQALIGTNPPYDARVKSKNHFAANDGGLRSEGYYWLLHRMKQTGIVNKVIVFIESNRYPGSTKIGNIPVYVVPTVEFIDQYLEPDDIIWVRGGFKQWHNWLVPKKGKHWLLLYAANTGRQRWKFWDVIFDDLAGENRTDRNSRVFLDFHKPIHPKIFYPEQLESHEAGLYDVCVGASHIHDKKGQFRTIRAIAKYKELFGINLKCVMPGRLMRGTNTSGIAPMIRDHGLNVELTGMLPRPKVNAIYNRSKLFVHLGGGGQGDRGPLEALRCGTQVLLGYPKRCHSVVCQNPAVSWVSQDATNPEEVAYEIKSMLHDFQPTDKTFISEYFENNNGIEKVCLPEMKRLFDFFRQQPKPNHELLVKEYGL
jgi:glycosyltransferase involved in cell wall biosynthesis